MERPRFLETRPVSYTLRELDRLVKETTKKTVSHATGPQPSSLMSKRVAL